MPPTGRFLAAWLFATGLLAGALAPPVLGLDPSRQLTQYRLRTWSLDDGLPQSTVAAITQTPDGYLWLATLDGLVRFDGFRFVGPDSWHGLPRVPPDEVATDSTGRLWVVGGEGLYRAVGDRFEEVRLDGERLLDAGPLVPRQAGGLWIGRRSSLLVANEEGQVSVFVDRTDNTIEGVTAAVDDVDQTCFLTGLGIECLIGEIAEVIVDLEEIAPQHSVVGPLLLARDGTLWVGTIGEGVVRIRNGVIDMRVDRSNGMAEGAIQSLIQDSQGSVWLGDGSGGFARLSAPGFERLELGSSVQNVRALFEDREGNLWLGSNAEGLAQLSDPPITVFSTPEGLPLAVVHAVLASDTGSTWVGLEGGGLVEIRRGAVARVLGERDGLPNLDVMSLAEDHEGRLLVGTAGGVVRWADGLFESVPGVGSPPAFSLFEDSRGNLWGGFLRHIRRFTDGAFRRVPWSTSNYVDAITETVDGSVWFGGSAGLLRLSPGADEAAPIVAEPPVPFVLALLADGDSLWVGTLGGGLGRWQMESGFASFGRAQGLCDEDVFTLLDDDNGHLWLSSNRGIFAVDKADALAVLDGTRPTLECRLFGRIHGMRQREASGGTQPAAWRDADGNLWFATIDGAVRFDAADLLTESPPPPVLVEELRTGEVRLRPPELAGPLTLGPSSRELEIDYTALHLAAPGALSFRYRLRGLEEEWVEAGSRRTAYYPHLAPGSYTFEAAARIGDGEWGAPGALAVNLEPRFFETKLFLGFVVGIGILALAALYRLRLAQLKKRQRVLEAAVLERTADLETARRDLEQANSTLERRVEEGVAALRDADRMAAYGHLVAGVAHELRHPLFAVQTAAHLLSSRFGDCAEAEQEVALLGQETARIQLLLEDLLELARPKNPTLIPTDLGPLLKEVVASYEAACAGDGGASLPIDTQFEGGLPRVTGEREKLVRMLLNLLHNARQHAGASHLVLRAEVREPANGESRRLVLSVRDDGIGIPQSRQATLFEPFVSGTGGTGLGLAIARRIAESHGGSIRVDSDIGHGTTFVVELPLS